MNTQELIAAGQKTSQSSIDSLVESLFLFSEARADRRLLNVWANNIGTVMDWVVAIAKATNTTYFYTPGAFPTEALYYFGGTMATIFAGMGTLAGIGDCVYSQPYGMLIQYGQTYGLQVRYNTQALVLVRPNNQGPVTGVIAKNSNGSYSQFNASKGVIIATGDIADNPEMVQYYVPWVPAADYAPAYSASTARPISIYNNGANTGDGLAMALWAGANVPANPGAGMLHFISTNKAPPIIMTRPVSTSGLFVNKFGDRFMNEALLASQPEYSAPTVVRQPGHTCWQIFDSQSVSSSNQQLITPELATGEVTSANTIAGLAATFGADPTRLTAAVNNYNQMIANGIDPDFGKDPSTFGPPNTTPPYYACESPPDFLVAIHGPLIDTSMRVLDTNNEPIQGLYAVGNSTSGFFGDGYPFSTFDGLCRGHALVTGAIAGQNAAMGTTASTFTLSSPPPAATTSSTTSTSGASSTSTASSKS
jgi:fumarate reductase flavoprotein subunit